MRPDPNFLKITIANLIARSAYQMGKTPLLPLFAAALGASDAFLGIIVSVSTFTGMVLKPFFGVLSDRSGRRTWLLIGTAFFAFMPFTYWLVDTPTQLFALRSIHGIATAIYGPVTLAYVTERWPTQRAERLGWFDSARTVGYILGPTLAGWLLLSLSPAAVFTIIGLISTIVFIPVMRLPESRVHTSQTAPTPILTEVKRALSTSGSTPAVWLSGGLEAITYIATYAMKAFLPVYALAQGTNVAVIGLFFGVQEGFTLVLKPFGGKLGDKLGLRRTIGAGMLILGSAFSLLPIANHQLVLLAAAVFIGTAQALIFPATTALVAEQINSDNLGAGMGLLGTMRNAGKVIGPVLGGILISRIEFTSTFLVLAGILIAGGLSLFLHRILRKTTPPKRPKKLDHPVH